MSEDYEARLRAELSAIRKVDTILRKLDEAARGRVVRHLADLHGKTADKP